MQSRQAELWIMASRCKIRFTIQFRYAARGYEVVMIFIRNKDAATSIQRVSMRVSQGGHDVPDAKLRARFKRTRANLARSIERLPNAMVFDNSDLSQPNHLADRYQDGQRVDNS